MNTKSKKEVTKGKVTRTELIRWLGLFAIMAGILYIVIQFIHPSDNITSVNTTKWVIVAGLTMVMSLFSLMGITGIYIKQVEESGWLGLIGYVTFGLFWFVSMTFSFIEAFVLPLITNDAPKFVEGLLGIFSGTKSEVNLGIFTGLAPVAGVLYMLGGLLLGIATFRAKVLPRMAGALLSLAAVGTLASAIIPHPFDRILAIPMGLAFIWLGYVVWSDTREVSKK